MKKVLLFLCVIFYFVQLAPAEPDKGQKPVSNNIATVNHAFSAGERLTYLISWSNIIDAGKATMEVREEKQADGSKYIFVSTAHSTGLVAKFYKVNDIIESTVDATKLNSLSYKLDQSHGKRKKKRTMTFNPAEGTVTVISDGEKETSNTPPGILDPLSSLYYVRTRHDFIVGKPIKVDVNEDGKNWTVEVQTLGREKLKTSFGKFETIKVKTYPRYEGVFQHTGEIYIWFTDDDRKIPVLMKSEITIGSIVATLIDMQAGDGKK